MNDQRLADERAVRSAWEAGNLNGATELTLRSCGAEIFGFLAAVHPDYDEACDAFSSFTEQLWRNMARFEWKCSLRTWTYLLARHALTDVRRRSARERRLLASDVDELAEIAERIRTETLSMLQTEKRSELEKLRDELPEDDRMLLILRLERMLSWREVALVFEAGEPFASEHAEATATARLRKRYQLVKERLKEQGRARGLL